MGERVLAGGEGYPVDRQERSGGGAQDWRTILRLRAEAVRSHTGAGDLTLPEAQRDVLAEAFGAAVDDVVATLDAFARGARRNGAVVDGQDRFAGRLDMLLHGFDASLATGTRESHGDGGRPQVIQSELWVILHKVRESAELFYAREIDLVELDRRVLFLLHGAGPLVPADISGAVGVDKAQVSRSVKRLLELRMVEREQIRAPLRLSRKGAALTERLSRLADLRNRELTFDIADEELDDFFATLQLLLDRALLLYEQERELAQPSQRGGGRSADQPGKLPERKAVDKIAIERTRIISPLMTLSAYFSRSGALAFKRLTGLSQFEAFVLSEIGIDPPISWGRLAAALHRDHSQAGRTIKALMDAGLIQREGKPGRRHGHFSPTEEGARLHRVIHDAGRERSAFLLAPLGPEQRARFLATVARIRRNAVAQLERERAFAEIGRS